MRHGHGRPVTYGSTHFRAVEHPRWDYHAGEYAHGHGWTGGDPILRAIAEAQADYLALAERRRVRRRCADVLCVLVLLAALGSLPWAAAAAWLAALR
jgi:hypothetical protein